MKKKEKNQSKKSTNVPFPNQEKGRIGAKPVDGFDTM